MAKTSRARSTNERRRRTSRLSKNLLNPGIPPTTGLRSPLAPRPELGPGSLTRHKTHNHRR
jgi:hypothetical protein